MSEQYMRDLLKVSIAQICQTIGYNGIQTTPLELLQDNLHKFLHEFCRDLRRHVEHYNRNEANLNDVCLTLGSLNINVNELLEYIFNVQPVAFAIDVPKFSVYKESNLNFLKPGSKEVLIRPVHIYEHLPPILTTNEFVGEMETESVSVHRNGGVFSGLGASTEEGNASNIADIKSDRVFLTKYENDTLPKHKVDGSVEKDSLTAFFKAKSNTRRLDEEGRPTREIGSVMMTTGGFISPAIEGKLPDGRIPDVIGILEGLDAPPPPPPPPRPPSVPVSGPSSRTSLATPTLVSASTIQPKPEVQEKPATSNTQVDKSTVPFDNSATPTEKRNSPTLSGRRISNASPCAITAAAASRLPKKHASAQNPALSPPMAARILKKAKKKTAMMPFPVHSKPGRPGFAITPSDISNPGGMDLNDKVQRKRMKMLQKLVKSAKSSGGDMLNFGGSPGSNPKNLHGLYNPLLLNSLPLGPERLQMEKNLKKQAKQKQKLLRHQMAIDLNAKHLENVEEQPRAEIPDVMQVPNSKIMPTAEQASNFLSSISQVSPCGKTSSKLPSNSAQPLTPGKVTKSSAAISPNTFLNSIPGYRGLKPGNIAMPVFGEVAFPNELPIKDQVDSRVPEVKLSTEPDRNKLNIFKKISSKQKQVNKAVSPTSKIPGTTQFYAGNESQVINLPSGTTITPAPPTSGRHVYAPEDTSAFFVGEEASKMNNTDAASLLSMQPTSSVLFGKSAIVKDQVQGATDILHKPKKRGRKPGSKNQPKVQRLGTVPGSTLGVLKKSKKPKMHNIFGASLQLPADQSAEPLNLSHSFSSSNDINSNIPLGIASTYPIFDPNALQWEMKESKERKKTKGKDTMATINEGLGPPLPGMHQQQRALMKKITDSPFAAPPTKEEVDSINRKLLRMDTVLQPAPPLQQLSLTIPHVNKIVGSKEMSLPPTKNMGVNNPSSTKQRFSQLRIPQSNAPLDGTIVPPVHSFPNITPNMLSMLPMYPFPPRPGLIPTPGLFPSVLGRFPNNSQNPATNMLLHGLLPFPRLNPSSSGILKSPGIKLPDKIDNATITEPSDGTERNYCNVAPLVPDSLKLKLSSPGTGSASCDRVNPKTPQMRHSPTVSETIRESLQQKLNTIGTPDNRSLASKSIPSTPGGISLNAFDNLLRSGSGNSTNSSTPNNSIGPLDSFKSTTFSQSSSENLKSVSSTASLNVDGPIEVSDDSEDAVQPANTTTSLAPKVKTPLSQRSYVKPPTLPAPLVGRLDELFIPIDNTKTSPGMNQQYMLSVNSRKEAKKIKKHNKLGKKSNSASPAASCSSFEACVSGAGSDGGVSKLAGGADLIPLSVTGLAYPSKSTPNNNLTVSNTSPFDISNREFGSVDVLGSLNAGPSSKMYAKRKDHKKLKKIKYGKIKKKKDKKDKTKNKEKYLEKIEKRIKEKDPDKHRDKDIIKKNKKEKRKEKQHVARDSLSSPTSATTTSHNLSPGSFDLSLMANPSNLPQFPSSAPLAFSSSSSVVPKLTLKLGNCQSPTPFDDTKRKQAHKTPAVTTASARESSPELARISPLVTRPPKQKTSAKDYLPSGATANVLSEIKASIDSVDFPNLSSPNISADNSLVIKSNKEIRNAISGSRATSTATAASKQSSSKNSSLQLSGSVHTTTTESFEKQLQNSTSAADAEGNRVWICPACGKVDDGSAMIGCDGCDAWYHWVCVGIFVAPKDNEDWFCRVCIAKKKGVHGIDKKRKRNKKSK